MTVAASLKMPPQHSPLHPARVDAAASPWWKSSNTACLRARLSKFSTLQSRDGYGAVITTGS